MTVLHEDDFADLARWHTEMEPGGSVVVRDRKLVIDVPAGCTVWFKPMLDSPIRIEYDATVIDAGGGNDRVSDLNCFWMATDARSPHDLFATERHGPFADYNELKCYYVGLGGNDNTTTRFRRYIGHPERRPLLPEHDLTEARFMIEPNRTYHITLIADGSRIEYRRDDETIFNYHDPQPYTRGHFAVRTVRSHLTIAHFRASSPA